MSRVLGLDLGLHRTGWALLGGDSPEVKAWGYLDYNMERAPVPPGMPREGQRLAWFRREIGNRLNKYKPDIVAIEDYTLAQARINPRTLASAAELGGVVRLACAEGGVPYTLWGPSEWKIHLWGTGRGNARKGEVVELTKEWFEIDAKELDHNQMEAFCVAMAEWDSRNGRPRQERKRK